MERVGFYPLLVNVSNILFKTTQSCIQCLNQNLVVSYEGMICNEKETSNQLNNSLFVALKVEKNSFDHVEHTYILHTCVVHANNILSYMYKYNIVLTRFSKQYRRCNLKHCAVTLLSELNI